MNIIVAVIVLGVIIIVHELGHFLLAKKNGITVTEFSVGMGPRIASFVKNGTRYSLKAFPIGGSCMMLGEDEAIEDEGAFHKKGVWARFSVIFAGAFFNFLLAFILALIVLGTNGVDLPKVTRVEAGTPAAQAGLKEGDLITGIDGNKINISREIDFYLYFNQLTDRPISITYLRDGAHKTISATPKKVSTYLLGCRYNGDNSAASLVQVASDYPLGQAGVAVGDVIVAIDGTNVSSGLELSDYFKDHPLGDKPVTVTYQRNGAESTVSVTPKLYTNTELGFGYQTWSEKVSALNVVKYSFYELKYNINMAIKGVWYLISGRVSVKEVSGPVGIVNVMDQIVSQTESYGIGIVLLNLASFSILLSANLGVMNLLPIPALDGGRLVFLVIEAIRRKPVPKEKEAMVHMIGMAALMIFMVFILFNDIKRIFG